MKDEEIAFFNAARENQVSSVRSYLEQGVSINTVNTYNETALIAATEEGSVLAVKALLESSDIDLHVQGFLTGTALTCSIFNDNDEIAQLLLASEQVFNNAEHPGAVNLAVHNENYALLQMLYQKGANMDTPGLTGLNFIPDWVLYKPAPDRSTTPFGREYHQDLLHTPFCLAILDKNSEMVKFLLTECRANPNQPDYDGSLPLQIAVDGNDEGMVALLLAQGANPELLTRVEDEVIPFHRGRRPPTNPKITAMLSRAKEERTSRTSISAASSATLFGVSSKQITFAPRLLEPFKDVFETAWMYFAEADIADMERNIIKHTIEEGVLSVQEFIELVKALWIPDILMTSLYILYCGLHPEQWEKTPSLFEGIRNNLLDNTVKLTLASICTADTEAKYATALKETAKTTCVMLFGAPTTLSREELDFKNDRVLHMQDTPDGSLPISPKGFLKSFIDAYMTDIEATVSASIASSGQLTTRVKVDSSGEQLRANLVDKVEKLLTTHTGEWKRIYDLIKLPPPYNRRRNELQMLNVVKAILYKEQHECLWSDLPHRYDYGAACYYYKRWQREKILEQIFSIASQLNTKTVSAADVADLPRVAMKASK